MYHPDAYGFNTDTGEGFFQREYQRPGEMYKWDLTIRSAGAHLGYMYTDMVMGTKVVLEFAAQTCQPGDTEQQAIQRVLEEFRGVLPNPRDPKGRAFV